MSKVQEIEAALSQLPPEDFATIERWMTEFKKRQTATDSGTAFFREYDLTPEELDRFDARMKEEIERDRREGKLKEFTGDLEKDWKIETRTLNQEMSQNPALVLEDGSRRRGKGHQ
jgi:hypothetical protein